MTRESTSKERLDSWKEIASYLDRSVRTVQRWERELGLPVRRVKSAKDAGSVYALKGELDAWLLEGNSNRTGLIDGLRRRVLSNPGSAVVILAVLAVLIALSAIASTLWVYPQEQQLHRLPIEVTRDNGLTANPTLSTDGKWLAYASNRQDGDDLDIWVQPWPLGNGSPVQVTNHPGNEISPNFSPDGKEIAWVDNRRHRPRMFATLLADRSERFVADGAGPRYSPDGRWIAGRQGAAPLFIVPAGGGPPTILPVQPTVYGQMAWSPDSRHLVTVLKPDARGAMRLGVTPIDGGPTREIALGPLYGSSKRAEPVQLTQLRFARESRDLLAGVLGGGDVWRMKLAPGWSSLEGVPKLLFQLPTGELHYPSWSDGRLIFGARFRNIDIVALPIDAETGAVQGPIERLTDAPTWSRDGSISADGSMIAYAGMTSDRSWRPWVKNLLTGESRTIDDRLMAAKAVRISPDSTKVAFRGVEGGPGERFIWQGGSTQSTSLFVHELASRSTREVCRDCGEPESWMSNGEKILTTINPPGPGNESVWLVDIGSGKRTKLLSDLYSPRPTFSPRDARIVFSNRDRIISAPFRDGKLSPQSEWIELVSEGAICRFPMVSPEGKILYFMSDRDGKWCFWARRLDPAQGRPRGEVFAVYHSHSFSSERLESHGSSPGLVRDKLIFHRVTDSGNIWMVEDVTLD